MKIDDYINDFVEKEKLTEANPFLATRIMSKIEVSEKRITPVWQKLLVAASVAFVIITGIGIGSTYSNAGVKNTALNVNDNQIENLTYYKSIDNE